jgi:hypothetical protein
MALSQLSGHVLDGFKVGGKHGRTDAIVWSLLSQTPQSAEAIRAQADKARRTVFRSLQTLASNGLAAKVKGGWIRGPKKPEQIAWERGTLGATERQRSRRVSNSARNARFHKRRERFE